MPGELVDIIDANENYTGVTKFKSEVRIMAMTNKNVWYGCGHLIITDGRGNNLETKRGRQAGSMRLARDPVSVAGSITALPLGKPRPPLKIQAWHTVVREAQEELGLEIDPEWFGTPRVIHLGNTRTDYLTNEGYSDRWWDRTISVNFMCVIPNIASKFKGFKLEQGKVEDPQMRPASLLQRVIDGKATERYANRPPDQKELLEMIMRGSAHFARKR